MTITVTDSATNSTITLEEGVTMYDVVIALKQLADHRRRSLKEHRGPKKNYYVPTGNPRGRPRKTPADSPPASSKSESDKIDSPPGV